MSEGSGGPFVWIFIFAISVQNSLSVVKADTVCNSKYRILLTRTQRVDYMLKGKYELTI